MENNFYQKLGFCPTPGANDIGNIANDFNDFRR